MKKLLLFLFILLLPFWVNAQTIGGGMIGGSSGQFPNISVNATLGSELITWTAAGWNEDGATWTVAGTPIVITHATGNTTALTSTLASAITAGVTYKVVITYAQVAGTCSYTLGGVTGSSIATSATSTSITDYITASTTVQMIITPLTTSNIVISSISIKALTDATGDVTVDGNFIARSPATFWGKIALQPSASATDAETVTGTATNVVTTPANITAKMAAPGIIGGTTPGVIYSRWATKTVSSTPVTLSIPEVSHGIVFVTTGASVVNLPAGAAALDGSPVKFLWAAAVSANIKPNGSQVISLQGTPLTGGNKITNSGLAGEEITLIWNNTASQWQTVSINGVFIDGGA